jgi:hypothetical protein
VTAKSFGSNINKIQSGEEQLLLCFVAMLIQSAIEIQFAPYRLTACLAAQAIVVDVQGFCANTRGLNSG